MKTCFRIVYLSLALLLVLGPKTSFAQAVGNGFFDPSNVSFQPGFADIDLGWPGRFWVEASFADERLGLEGSYITLGAKQHLFQDFMDGRWLLEARGHYDPEFEGFFANVGLERVFTLFGPGAEVTTGFWFDFDDSQQRDFSHSLTSISVNASIETHRWALTGNGYFPIGDTDFQLGDPLNGVAFVNNALVTQGAIDSSLRGFDALFEFKPQFLQSVGGSIGIGGYGYGSDIVDFFGGVRARTAVQLNNGMQITAEINHDNTFDVTGVLSVGWFFGSGARGTEYGFIGNDLDPTLRTDHIVRFAQDLELAIDPDTGAPYNVFHVNNQALAGGDGTFENPFNNLADAAAASGQDAIIFVEDGDGTTFNQNMGIALQQGQQLLGAGVQHLIPLANGTNFILPNNVDGNLPTITNIAGDAVTLSSRNTVRGFIIDGTEGGLVNGISGGAATNNFDGIIEDVTITGNPILNGIFLDNISGDWQFARNNIQTAFLDGIFIDNANDPTSVFNFDSNIVSNNGRDGIHIEDFDAETLNFMNNTTNGNGRDGIRLERFVDSAGDGLPLEFINPTASGNVGNGISLFDIAGDIRFINPQILNNLNSGISLVNVTSPGVDDMVFIGTAMGGTSLFDGNGAGTGAGIFNELGVSEVQNLFITNTTIQNGGSGIISNATAPGAFLTTSVIDNILITNNAADGISLGAFNGALHNATVLNNGAPLPITGNGGDGISLNSAGTGPISLLEAVIDNVAITGVGFNGFDSEIIENGSVIAQVTNSTVTGAIDGINIFADNDSSAAINRFTFDNVTITAVGDDGVDLDIMDQTFIDFTLTNSTLTNPMIGNNGIEITADGDAAAVTDTRARVTLIGNTITGFDTGQGISLVGTGDANILFNLDGNTITGNGINQITGAPTLPFGDGVDILATGTSEIFARITNNTITGNAEQGIDLTTLGAGSITTIVEGNDISNNDTQDDGATLPIESGNVDMTAFNAVAGNICVGLSNNLFNLPVVFANASGPANFVVEVDGLSNGFVTPVLAPAAAAFTVGTFSTVCEPAIVAEEAAFGLNGF